MLILSMVKATQNLGPADKSMNMPRVVEGQKRGKSSLISTTAGLALLDIGGTKLLSPLVLDAMPA